MAQTEEQARISFMAPVEVRDAIRRMARRNTCSEAVIARQMMRRALVEYGELKAEPREANDGGG